jgi:hypothetical protein
MSAAFGDVCFWSSSRVGNIPSSGCHGATRSAMKLELNRQRQTGPDLLRCRIRLLRRMKTEALGAARFG